MVRITLAYPPLQNLRVPKKDLRRVSCAAIARLFARPYHRPPKRMQQTHYTMKKISCLCPLLCAVIQYRLFSFPRNTQKRFQLSDIPKKTCGTCGRLSYRPQMTACSQKTATGLTCGSVKPTCGTCGANGIFSCPPLAIWRLRAFRHIPFGVGFFFTANRICRAILSAAPPSPAAGMLRVVLHSTNCKRRLR